MGWDGDVLLPGGGWGHFQEMLEFNLILSIWTTMNPATTATPWALASPVLWIPKKPQWLEAAGPNFTPSCQDNLEMEQRSSKAKQHHITKCIPKT